MRPDLRTEAGVEAMAAASSCAAVRWRRQRRRRCSRRDHRWLDVYLAIRAMLPLLASRLKRAGGQGWRRLQAV